MEENPPKHLQFVRGIVLLMGTSKNIIAEMLFGNALQDLLGAATLVREQSSKFVQPMETTGL